MNRIRFDPVLNWGHLLMTISFLVPALIYGIGFWGDFRVLKHDVERHEQILSRMEETQEKTADALRMAVQNQALGFQRLADHIDKNTDKK